MKHKMISRDNSRRSGIGAGSDMTFAQVRRGDRTAVDKLRGEENSFVGSEIDDKSSPHKGSYFQSNQ